ncbi:Putative glycosyltransferase EpsE [Pontiella desulfatans]|uniref:Glycosyltransferase EpsE n=1 Tax=Pontiella desulfatans TaxID=2750659 RepID=A0A6C2TWT2_PONDE|nr:glycosyltransferase [Pontiella desulfatans]VGO12145.1 Putative glycosyltransferase EpsE [Pontiella desulfatans]
MNPIVSVVLTAFNADAHVGDAIESILKQTWTDFEFIIVDDGSDDGTRGIIEEFAARDDRIVFICNEKNQGQPQSRNAAIEQATGEFIAIMDADDVAYPHRLKTQVEYLKNHSEIGVVASLVRMIDGNGKRLGMIGGYAASAPEIVWRELTQLSSSMVHPSVMFRRSLVRQYNLHYNPEYPHSQDKELWGRFLLHSKGTVISKVLLKYRTHANSISQAKAASQQEYALRAVVQMNCSLFGDGALTSAELEQMVLDDGSFGSKGWQLKMERLDQLKAISRFNDSDVGLLRGMAWIDAGVRGTGYLAMDWWRYGFSALGVVGMFKAFSLKMARFCRKAWAYFS